MIKPSSQLKTWQRMAITMVMGFSSGLPFLLTGGTFKMWLARESIDLKTIGFMSWVGLAYSLKFMWAPLLDRYQLTRNGRRKSWLILTQVALVGFLAIMGTFDPTTSLTPLVITTIIVAFFSATQDSIIDAYRREFLPDDEMGLGASMTTYGYRIAMLLSGGLGIGLVGEGNYNITWNQLYFAMAALMSVGLITSFFIPEPEVAEPPPKSLQDAIIEPFKEFFTRPQALLLLTFVIAFKLGDSISGQMLNKFYVDMQFTNQDVGFIAKTVGLFSSLVGLFLGGILIKKLKVYRALIIFGVLQALSTAYFMTLTLTGPQNWALALAVIFEDITSGMGTSAFLAFMAMLTNKRFSATQYALLASFASLGRNFFSGFSGIMVEQLGWANFFITCGLLALPGIFMAVYIKNKYV